MTQFKEASPAAVKANVRQWRKEHQLDKPAPKPAGKIPAPTNKIKLSGNKIVLSFNSTTGELEVES